jgi:hypothetical protein
MRLARLAVAALSAQTAFGFAPAARRAFVSSTKVSMANVLRLENPQTQLLDQVDVFIFDCDGVIWRVSWRRVCWRLTCWR